MNLGFLVVRGLYDVNNHTKDIPNLLEYFRELTGKDDRLTPGAPAFYNNIELNKTHIRLLPKIEKLTDYKLYPTYNYSRKYNAISMLAPHKDRPACEVSVTMNLGYDGDYSWPIWITGSDDKDYEVILEPGDGLIYMGCELTHWRQEADKRVKYQAQGFFHYVNQDGPYADCIFDNIKS